MAKPKTSPKELTEKQKRNAELKAGADKLRKEKAASAKVKKEDKKKDSQIVVPKTPVQLLGKEWEPSKERTQDIIAERVQMASGNVGVILDTATPLEEYPAIIDYFQKMEEHVGFFIGDALNYGRLQHGEKFDAMLAVTGMASSTLYAYARTAAAIPVERRQANLPFTHHRKVARIEDPQKQLKLLTDAAEVVSAGKPYTAKDMEKAAVKAEPPKKSKSAPGTSKKPKASKKAPAPEPEKYTDEEQAIYDDVLNQLLELDETLGSKAGQAFLSKTLKVDNKLKRPISARGKWITRFLFEVEKATGY